MLPSVPYAQVASAGDAVDKAEALHMTSQRATKGYLAIAQGIQPELAVKVRDAAMTQFDPQLTDCLDECRTEPWLLTHTESRHLRRVSTVFGHLSQSFRLA